MRRSAVDSKHDLKGVWCYPFTRNKVLNGNWKRNLKTWRNERTNFNGFVFRLTEHDFPLYAGEFGTIWFNTEGNLIETYPKFIELYGKYLSPQELLLEVNDKTKNEPSLDLDDFEIVLPNGVSSDRIIKVIKDRMPANRI